MQKQRVQTPFGQVVFWGRFSEFRGGPLALVIRGLFAPADHLLDLDLGMDTVFAHLPGFWTPFLRESTIANFAAAFDVALTRKPHVLGVSVGGLVGLAMKNTASVTAVDPPLQTAAMPQVAASTQRFLSRTESAEFRAWAWNVLGYTPELVENRDYRPLVDRLSRPATVIVASEPPELERDGWLPGLVTPEDRAWLARHPMVRLVEAPCGHDVPGEWRQGMVEAFKSRHLVAGADYVGQGQVS